MLTALTNATIQFNRNSPLGLGSQLVNPAQQANERCRVSLYRVSSVWIGGCELLVAIGSGDNKVHPDPVINTAPCWRLLRTGY
jgi:hypothetical protein